MKGETLRSVVAEACLSLDWGQDWTFASATCTSLVRETRLRFNALVAAEAAAVEARVARQGVIYLMEIEGIFWVDEGVWEIWNATYRRD